MEEEIKSSGHHPADTNGDGKVSKAEQEMYLEFKRKELLLLGGRLFCWLAVSIFQF